MGRIVVGVDGSEGSEQALRWAAEEAGRRQATLEPVLVFSYPSTIGIGMAPEVVLPQLEEVEKRAAEALHQTLDGVLPRGRPRHDVRPRVERGRAAEVLLELSRDADLLVVGSRGLGGFRGLLLGSVSQQCVLHAPCPVVVVPHRRSG